jgi:hypothetical protein
MNVNDGGGWAGSEFWTLQYNDVLSFLGEDIALTAFQSEAEARRGACL